MARQTKPKTIRKARRAPSMLDEMEAMLRHPAFKHSLALWQCIIAKQYADLTEDEAAENNAPRTRFRIAAIMEAQDQWLTLSIQQIRNQDEAEWALDAVNRPFGDDTATLNASIPLYLSIEAIKRYVEQRWRQEQKKSGVSPIQRARRPEVDPWAVYDLRHLEGLNFADITKRICKKPPYLEVGDGPSNPYRQVRSAYKFACEKIESIEADSR